MAILIIGLATFLSTLLGGVLALRFKDKLHLILGFSAGAVLGVALFDLLPESMSLSVNSYPVDLIALFIGLGFVIFMILDRLFSLHFHEDDHCENKAHQNYLGASALSIHSFLDGLGIGLAFKVSPAVGWIVAIAVLAHDFSDGINTVNMILKDKGNLNSALKWLILDAIAPIIGIASTFFFTVSEPALGLILAIFAGFFLFIGASDLIPESHHRHPAIWTTLATILGMAIIYSAVHLAS